MSCWNISEVINENSKSTFNYLDDFSSIVRLKSGRGGGGVHSRCAFFFILLHDNILVHFILKKKNSPFFYNRPVTSSSVTVSQAYEPFIFKLKLIRETVLLSMCFSLLLTTEEDETHFNYQWKRSFIILLFSKKIIIRRKKAILSVKALSIMQTQFLNKFTICALVLPPLKNRSYPESSLVISFLLILKPATSSSENQQQRRDF